MFVPALLLLFLPVAYAAQALTFVQPSVNPTSPSPNYVGASNFTLNPPAAASGPAFGRFIFILFENTAFSVANTSPVLTQLKQQGILLTKYFSLAHPSEPNYLTFSGGSTFGLAADSDITIPPNVTTVVDLLEEKGIAWATYQENMPCDGYNGESFASKNYLQPSSTTPLTFYFRKHNPFVQFEAVRFNAERAKRIRNYNDFAADIQANSLPPFVMMTPNIQNDGHDSTPTFVDQYLQYFLTPLLNDTRFNGPDTLIMLTYDEDDSAGNNQVYTLLLGNAIPATLRGTQDTTYHTHYSVLSTIQSNWGLNCLGREDTNKTLSNVFNFVAAKTGYQNLAVTNIPVTNKEGATPGPFNPTTSLKIPFAQFTPNVNAQCASPSGVVMTAPIGTINTGLFVGNCPVLTNTPP
ncbi:phosphoesterase family-domain-containing protein [Hysterangium stoloniferum]|nr:phosphoesterase family-domain-containing protein [Hysterangium stoloniferum]